MMIMLKFKSNYLAKWGERARESESEKERQGANKL